MQVAVFSAEVIAGGAVADEGAVNFCGRGENFSGGEIRPIAAADEAAGLDPIEFRIECGDSEVPASVRTVSERALCMRCRSFSLRRSTMV